MYCHIKCYFHSMGTFILSWLLLYSLRIKACCICHLWCGWTRMTYSKFIPDCTKLSVLEACEHNCPDLAPLHHYRYDTLPSKMVTFFWMTYPHFVMCKWNFWFWENGVKRFLVYGLYNEWLWEIIIWENVNILFWMSVWMILVGQRCNEEFDQSVLQNVVDCLL